SASAQRHFVMSSRHFLRAYLYWMDLTSAEVRRITVNGSDGQRPSQAQFAPSAPAAVHVAIPDPHFSLYEGFRTERELARSARRCRPRPGSTGNTPSTSTG